MNLENTLNIGKTNRVIYTDGGCYNTGNVGDIGSFAFLEPVDMMQGYVDVYGGYSDSTTNNRMEMIAVINGIKHVDSIDPGSPLINVVSDSGYLVKGYTDPAYLDKWIANGWRTSKKEPVQNKDLWEELLALSWHVQFTFTHIRGHKKDKNHLHAFWNDICDKCCTFLMKEVKREGDLFHMRYYFNDKTIKLENQKGWIIHGMDSR